MLHQQELDAITYAITHLESNLKMIQEDIRRTEPHSEKYSYYREKIRKFSVTQEELTRNLTTLVSIKKRMESEPID